MFLIQLLTLTCLILIFYQDMRYRAVYWWCFPVLMLLLIFIKQTYVGMEDTLIDTGFVLLFFAFQMILLWAYFAIKNKKPVNIFKHYLGLGDVLFLVALAGYLSPVNYVLFYIASLVVVLLYTLIEQKLYKQVNPQIPLAGLQASMLLLLLTASFFHTKFTLYSDFWILKY
jgi:phosphoglycerol transferase MdoB-like AlkP superfamily enzyme